MTLQELALRNFAITTICLDTDIHAQSIGPAGATPIYPGMWVAPARHVVPQPGGTQSRAPLIIAIEQGELGKTIHEAYDEGDFVNVILPRKNDFIAVRVTDEAVVEVGDVLVCNGDGTFRPLESGENDLYGQVVAIAACDASESDAIPIVTVLVL